MMSQPGPSSAAKSEATHSRSLYGAVLLFVLLDLCVLLTNFWIAQQVDADALKINLAGRQRMLSQRMTKSLLLISGDSATRSQAESEFLAAAIQFDSTLRAFDVGGNTLGSSGRPISLPRVLGTEERSLVNQTKALWNPTRILLSPYLAASQPIPTAVLEEARHQLLVSNTPILERMNSLTYALERNSQKRANMLRLVQTTVFVLALLNFLFIVHSFHLRAREASESSDYYSQLAMRDPLTGLHNRRQFMEALAREIRTAQRSNGSFGLLLIDLDRFKPVNDQFGHGAGDTVLKVVADRLVVHARGNDTIARIGGDEFVLICPDLCEMQGITHLCERLLSSLNADIRLPNGTVNVGASIGIALYPQHADSVDALVHLADQAMYHAKQAGRNQWQLATTDQDHHQAASRGRLGD